MKHRLVPSGAILALALAVIVGCSADLPTRPDLSTRNALLDFGRVVGPTDLLLVVDISDAVGSETLAAEFAGLKMCLQDTELFPEDGRVSLAIVAYADSAVMAANLMPVTPATVNDIFGPALDSLLANPPVGTASADLALALGMAGDALGASEKMDKQALLVGSGSATDAAAASQACADLATAGVLLSAVAVSADSAGTALLGDCAAGYYAEAGEDPALDCDAALAWMLLVTLDAEPETAELDQGMEHGVTAVTYRGREAGDDRLAGMDVTFAIVDGPNLGAVMDTTVVSDSTGSATFSYVGDMGKGIDIIVASILQPNTGETVTDTVTVEWRNAPPVCDAGGPYDVEAETDTVTVALDASGSTDADGDSLSFAWSADCGTFDDATSATPTLTLTGDCTCGDVEVSVTVSDGTDESVCDVTVSVTDRRPPVVELKDPMMLWPPNHKLVAITADMLIESVEDICDGALDLADGEIVEVRSNEPVNGLGDGNTEPDVVLTCEGDLQVRAERSGTGQGRFYTVVYRFTDSEGNAADVEAHVIVPHDQGGKKMPLEGDGHTVTADCGDGGGSTEE